MENKIEFKELFEQLIRAFEAAGNDADVDKVIMEVASKHGFDEKELEELTTMLAMMDDLQANEVSLEEAKKNGSTRQDWFSKKMGDVIDVLPEEQQDDAVKVIAAVQQKSIENMAEE